MGSNETTANTGLVANAVMVIFWWGMGHIYGLEATPEVVAAAGLIVTFAWQRYAPPRSSGRE